MRPRTFDGMHFDAHIPFGVGFYQSKGRRFRFLGIDWLWGWAIWMCACGDSPRSTLESPAVQPRLHGVEYAQTFGFSESGDTLWLENSEGVWKGWVRETDPRRPSAPATSVPEGRAAGGIVELTGRVQGVATWSTTHVPHLLALGAERAWRAGGYLDRLDVQGVELSGVVDLGGDAGLDEEALVGSGASVLTSYPFGDPMQGVEERTGVAVMALREYEEKHPLGRAEYIKVFGWLTGTSPLADSIFDAIAARYDSACATGRLAAEQYGRPSVFTGSEQGGMWTAPNGEGLVAKLIEDAGGHYLMDTATEKRLGLRREGSNLEMDQEQFVLLMEQAEAWGKVVHAPDGWYLEDARSSLPWLPLEEKLMFHCNTAEVDYFGAAVLEPDLMLEDLVAILHEEASEGHEAVYFQSTMQRP